MDSQRIGSGRGALPEIYDALAVGLRTAHVFFLVFGDDTISEKLTILRLHLLATNVEHVLISRHDFASYLWAEQLFETVLLSNQRDQVVVHALKADQMTALETDGPL